MTEQNEPLLSSLDESSTVSLSAEKTINNPSVVNIVNETDGSNMPLLIDYEVNLLIHVLIGPTDPC